MRLQNKVALITGAASGLGRAIAETFAQEGAQIIVADLDLVNANVVAENIKKNGGVAIALAMDVTDEKQVEEGVEKAIAVYGGIDILVSNAGVQHIAPVDELPFTEWKKLLAIHLDGAFLTTRACLKNMYQRGKGGSIIYMGSIYSKEAALLKAPYATAKHGLIGLCKTVAKEGAAHGVRANIICPGFVRTPLVDKQIPAQAKTLNISEEDVVKKIMLKDTVDGEFTTVEDIAQAALFFATFDSNALTGQSLVVTHGWCMQ